ncbi:Kinesin-like protein kif27 [Phlyctochytrium planicorne]|nr:Kinesin-like protein kif27 [Phlyctochytrium planicorne]
MGSCGSKEDRGGGGGGGGGGAGGGGVGGGRKVNPSSSSSSSSTSPNDPSTSNDKPTTVKDASTTSMKQKKSTVHPISSNNSNSNNISVNTAIIPSNLGSDAHHHHQSSPSSHYINNGTAKTNLSGKDLYYNGGSTSNEDEKDEMTLVGGQSTRRPSHSSNFGGTGTSSTTPLPGASPSSNPNLSSNGNGTRRLSFSKISSSFNAENNTGTTNPGTRRPSLRTGSNDPLAPSNNNNNNSTAATRPASSIASSVGRQSSSLDPSNNSSSGGSRGASASSHSGGGGNNNANSNGNGTGARLGMGFKNTTGGGGGGGGLSTSTSKTSLSSATALGGPGGYRGNDSDAGSVAGWWDRDNNVTNSRTNLNNGSVPGSRRSSHQDGVFSKAGGGGLPSYNAATAAAANGAVSNSNHALNAAGNSKSASTLPQPTTAATSSPPPPSQPSPSSQQQQQQQHRPRPTQTHDPATAANIISGLGWGKDPEDVANAIAETFHSSTLSRSRANMDATSWTSLHQAQDYMEYLSPAGSVDLMSPQANAVFLASTPNVDDVVEDKEKETGITAEDIIDQFKNRYEDEAYSIEEFTASAAFGIQLNVDHPLAGSRSVLDVAKASGGVHLSHHSIGGGSSGGANGGLPALGQQNGLTSSEDLLLQLRSMSGSSAGAGEYASVGSSHSRKRSAEIVVVPPEGGASGNGRRGSGRKDGGLEVKSRSRGSLRRDVSPSSSSKTMKRVSEEGREEEEVVGGKGLVPGVQVRVAVQEQLQQQQTAQQQKVKQPELMAPVDTSNTRRWSWAGGVKRKKSKKKKGVLKLLMGIAGGGGDDDEEEEEGEGGEGKCEDDEFMSHSASRIPLGKDKEEDEDILVDNYIKPHQRSPNGGAGGGTGYTQGHYGSSSSSLRPSNASPTNNNTNSGSSPTSSSSLYTSQKKTTKNATNLSNSGSLHASPPSQPPSPTPDIRPTVGPSGKNPEPPSQPSQTSAAAAEVTEAIRAEMPRFEKEIKKRMYPEIFRAGELIIKKHDIGKEMYFLSKGKVEVISGDGRTVYSIINRGSFFGELGVLFNVPRTASVRSVVDCFCMVLTRESLEDVLQYFPNIAARFRSVAEQRMKEVSRKRSYRRRMEVKSKMEIVDELPEETLQEILEE